MTKKASGQQSSRPRNLLDDKGRLMIHPPQRKKPVAYRGDQGTDGGEGSDLTSC